MNLPERNFAIEIERQNVLIARPVFILPGHVSCAFCAIAQTVAISVLPIPLPRGDLPNAPGRPISRPA